MIASLVEVLWTARYDYQSHWRLERHEHEYFQMIYFISGRGSILMDDAEYPIVPGSFVLVKPRCVHALNASSLVKTLDVKFHLKGKTFRKQMTRAKDRLEDTEEWSVNLLERIRREGEQQGKHFRDLCNLLLAELLLLYLRHSDNMTKIASNEVVSRESSMDQIVAQATQFIRDHHAEECDLTQIARVVGRSDRHVRQHFQDTLNISPRRYLLQYRVYKSQEFIKYSSYAFKEIAEMVGFKTVHHFTRVFHEICGEPPGTWRKKYQAGICKDVNIDPRFVNGNWTVQTDTVIKKATRAR